MSQLPKRVPVAGLYCELERQLATAPSHAKPQLWQAFIGGLQARGVSDEEIRWSGVLEFLKGREGMVSRDQVVAAVRARPIRLEEAQRDLPRQPGELLSRELSLHLPDCGFRLTDGEVHTEAARMRYSVRPVLDGHKTLTIQELKSDWGRSRLYEVQSHRIAQLPGVQRMDWSDSYGTGCIVVKNQDDPAAAPQIVASFKRHVGGVIAQLHCGDGQIRCIGSFQDKDAAGAAVRRTEVFHHRTVNGEILYFLDRQDAEDSSVMQGAPDAPFVSRAQSWVALLLKRAIAKAVEHGCDSVSWPSGLQLAQQQGLTREIVRIAAARAAGPGGFGAPAFALDYLDTKGEATHIEYHSIAEMQSCVGPEMARAIADALADRDAKPASFPAKGLHLGGESLRSFYDAVVPSIAAPLIERLGGDEVVAADLAGAHHHGFEVTPLMKRVVEHGMPLFGGAPLVHLRAADAERDLAEEIADDSSFDFEPQRMRA